MDIYHVFHLAVVTRIAYDGLVSKYVDLFPGQTPHSLLSLCDDRFGPSIYIRYGKDHVSLVLRGFPQPDKGVECDGWEIKEIHIADPAGVDLVVGVINAVMPGWIEWERLRDVARDQGDRLKAVFEGIEEVDPF